MYRATLLFAACLTCLTCLAMGACLAVEPPESLEAPSAEAPSAAQLTTRLRTHAVMGADRSGDLRPEAAAILDAAAATDHAITRRDLEQLGLLAPRPAGALRAWAEPATIRVWRRRVDGSTASCSGRVDEIPFEDYVRGVLPHEWISSWEPESLKAGAVVIRTYAAWWVNRGGKYDCADLDDTTASQVYTDATKASTDAAVLATRQIYVVKDGELVFAEYSAENSDPTKFGVIEPHCTGRELFGHGRGTCQWGSQRWAKNDGKTFDWIVPHYYPGSELADLFDPVDPTQPDPPTGATPGTFEPAAGAGGADDPPDEPNGSVSGGCRTGGGGAGMGACAILLLGAFVCGKRRRDPRRRSRRLR